jgi:hypothetical protein
MGPMAKGGLHRALPGHEMEGAPGTAGADEGIPIRGLAAQLAYFQGRALAAQHAAP